jgi:phage baseplate assembly protein gpV
MFNEFFHKMLSGGLETFGLFYGDYKCQVVGNADPDNRGRLKLHSKALFGDTDPDFWAEPQALIAGKSFGLWCIPDVGEWVHVTFDHGRLDAPIWRGGWWAQGETTPDMVPTKVVLATKEGMKMVFDRPLNTITVENDDGSNVVFSQDSIQFNHFTKIAITCPTAEINATDVKVQADTVDIEATTITITGNTSIN